MIIAVGSDGLAGYGVTTDKAIEELDHCGGGSPLFYIEVPDTYFVLPAVPTLKIGE